MKKLNPVFVVVVVILLGHTASHHLGKRECVLDQATQAFQKVTQAYQKWNKNRHLVKVDQDRFEELWREICPELLTVNGVPWEKVYNDMLRQFDGRLIDEAFVRSLLEQLKNKKDGVTYDGEAFYGFKDPSGKSSEPTKPIDPGVIAREKISVKFYLDNAEFYSDSIFRILTKQHKVRFVGEITEEGYLFEALRNMTQQEFFTICSDGKAPDPKKLVEKGARWTIPAKQLRQVSRILSVDHTFTDHRGQRRQVTAHLDLKKYTTGSPVINILPDGTVLTDGKHILRVGENQLSVTEVAGRYVKRGEGGQYVLGGKVVFEWRGGECSYNKYGPCSNTTLGQAYPEESTGRDILEVVVNKGTISMNSPDGDRHRVISYNQVTDGEGKVITHADDIGVKFQQQVLRGGKKLTAYPDLDAFVETSPFIRKLAGDIIAPYRSRCGKAKAILAFVQSFPYKEFMIPGAVKSPKDSYLSQEMDCEDASVKAISLWKAAGFKAGFLRLRPKRGKIGHAAPMINESSGCSGEGIQYGGETWLFAEATGKRRWRIGQDMGYKVKFWFHLFQPSGGLPVSFKK